jgi:hypothetical protein
VLSSGFAFAAAIGGRGAITFEEGVDHFEDGALLSGGERFDLLEALQRRAVRGCMVSVRGARPCAARGMMSSALQGGLTPYLMSEATASRRRAPLAFDFSSCPWFEVDWVP